MPHLKWDVPLGLVALILGMCLRSVVYQAAFGEAAVYRILAAE